jgi:hypothetical protein
MPVKQLWPTEYELFQNLDYGFQHLLLVFYSLNSLRRPRSKGAT